ncbi:MAG: magnesium transporter, partial [Bdellovibrio sp.]|nr:magnesium transporter [Bdellovibrio sp.]
MLVNCVAYQNGHKVADLRTGELHRKMKEPGTLVWVALKDPEPAEFDPFVTEFKLHELAVEDALRGHQRPKIEEYGDSLFMVLHTIQLDADGELEIGEVDVFVGPGYILSVRNRTLEGFAKVRERCEQEPELLKNGSVFVLY